MNPVSAVRFGPSAPDSELDVSRPVPLGRTSDNNLDNDRTPGPRARNGGTCLQASVLPDLHTLGDTMAYPRWVYEPVEADHLFPGAEGAPRRDGIPDAALERFQCHYRNDTITKDDIFDYTCAVLHHRSYRERWGETLRLEYPRLPMAPDFPELVRIG